MSKKKFNILILVIIIILIILTIGMLYRTLIESNIFKGIDFFAFEINNVNDYSLCKNSVDIYYSVAEKDFNNIQYFFRKFDKEIQKGYSDYLSQSYTNCIIKSIKKSLDGVYVVYFNRNQDDTNESRIVLKFSFGHFYVLADSIYEKYKEEK